tara:strand:+ start:648 stop:1352 length:705 start_codon:yes stop_codon:yes gene_type:complete
MKNTIKLTLLSLILSSCVHRSGNITHENITHIKNAKISGIAMGQSSDKKILYIGGLNKPSLVFEAKTHLLDNNQLTDKQFLANFTIEYKYSNFILMRKTTVTVHAEIIDTSTNATRASSYAITNFKGYKKNDTIIVTPSYLKGVISELGPNKITTSFKTGKNKKNKYSNCFNVQGNVKVDNKLYAAGDIITVYGEDLKLLIDFTFKDHEILGFSGHILLLKSKTNGIKKVRIYD